MTAVLQHTTPRSATSKISEIDRRIQELLQEKRDALAQLSDDLRWMDIPTATIPDFSVESGSERSEILHLLSQLDERTGHARFSAHEPGRCLSEGHWCRSGQDRRTRAHHGKGIQFTFLGTFRVLARIDDEIHLGSVSEDGA